jgi:uncharacterized membrane protein (UPF0127 family)
MFLGAENAQNICSLEFKSGYKIENILIADTEETRRKGLSKRKEIEGGMIFVWSKPKIVSFWMKDTIIPLSVGFFDKNGELFQIEDMEPLSLDSHTSSKEAIAALELKKGDFKKQNIVIGEKISKFKCR